MSMSELKRQLLKYELAKAGFKSTEYHAASGNMLISPYNDRMPRINDEGDIHYGAEYDHMAVHTIRPLVDRVNELVAAWDNAPAMPYKEVSRFRKLAEYNNIVLAARDDSEKGYGMHFVTWLYNRDRTGVELGHYGTDYAAAKEDFTVRAGLIPETKLLTKEQVAEIHRAIAYRIENSDIPLEVDEQLRAINARLADGYELSEKNNYPEKTEAYIYSEAINGEIQSSDLVIASSSSKYDCLIGKVTKIDKHGTPEHDTGNPDDDVHVDFTIVDYSNEMKARILELFDNYGSTAIFFEGLPLDDVIMAPDMLIRISELDSQEINSLAVSYDAAESFCKKAVLMARLEKNINDYFDSLPSDKHVLFNKAWEIAAKQDVYSYMTASHLYSDSEVEYLLKFQDPLAVVADDWERRREDISDISYALHHVFYTQDALRDGYVLMPDADKEKIEQHNSTERKVRTSIEDRLRDARDKVASQAAHSTPGERNSKRDIPAIE